MARERVFRCKYVVVALAATCLMWPHARDARATDPPLPPPPSSENGHALAEKLCSGCHVTGATASGVVPAGPPTFPTIANKPGQSGQHIMNVLIQPHVPMPDVHLTRQEILDITAYLETLRTNKDVPPLLPPPGGPKPQYPEPS